MSTHVRRNDSLIVREMDDEILVLDTFRNQIHQLNQTASVVWRMCNEGATAETVVAALTQQFAVDEATVAKDVGEVLSLMRSLHLLADGPVL